MTLKAIEAQIITLLTEHVRRELDVITDTNDVTSMYTELGIDATLTNNDLEAGGYNFTKAQLTDALVVMNLLSDVLTPTNKAKLYRIAQTKRLR